MIKNVFKSNTVEGIVANLATTVSKLEKLRESKLADAGIAQQMIDATVQIRDENIAEAQRAEKIANNVKKLLDIS